MTLTERQQRFLNEYVRKHSFKGDGKKERANKFSIIRQSLMDAIKRAPPDLPELPRLLLDLKRADENAEELKFDRASASISVILDFLKEAIKKYKPPTDPTASLPGNTDLHQELKGKLDAIVGIAQPPREWIALTNNPALGGDFKMMGVRAKALLSKAAPTAGELNTAKSLIGEIEVKRKFAERRIQEINKRKEQLKKYAEQLVGVEAMSFDGFFMLDNDAMGLAERATTLGAKDTATWTRTDETLATSMYLDMMLMLSERDNVDHKNFKAIAGVDQETGQDKEIVLAVRRKYKQGDDGAARTDESNFKLVVKPMTKEIGVPGFAAGGGASREMMASVIGDKIQEMLGIELNVAKTKLVQLDGGQIGLNAGEKVTASVQAFIKRGKSPLDIADEIIFQRDGKPSEFVSIRLAEAAKYVSTHVSDEEIQDKAVFDFLTLHCDRHAGNFIVDAENKLVPIDHGNILPTREGLRNRAQELRPDRTVLGSTAAAEKPLRPEILERIERLNVDELVQTMVGAKNDMDQQTPGADAGNLDEGIQNAKRSAEFLKFAARQLTLKQIYEAYSTQQENIFLTKDEDKLAGFARAVLAIRPNPKVLADAEKKYGPLVYVRQVHNATQDKREYQGNEETRALLKETDELLEKKAAKDRLEVKEANEQLQKAVLENKMKLLDDIRKLGWFGSNVDVNVNRLFDIGLPRLWEIIDQQLTAPRLTVPQNIPKKAKTKLSDDDWLRFQALGGEEAAKRLGTGPKDGPSTMLAELELDLVRTGNAP